MRCFRNGIVICATHSHSSAVARIVGGFVGNPCSKCIAPGGPLGTARATVRYAACIWAIFAPEPELLASQVVGSFDVLANVAIPELAECGMKLDHAVDASTLERGHASANCANKPSIVTTSFRRKKFKCALELRAIK